MLANSDLCLRLSITEGDSYCRDMRFAAFTQGTSIDQGVAEADEGEEDFEIGATAKRAPVAVLL